MSSGGNGRDLLALAPSGGATEGVHRAAMVGPDRRLIGTLSVASPASRVDDAAAASRGEATIKAARLIPARLAGEA